MRSIELKKIAKSFGKEVIFDCLDLNIPEGSFFTLLGPSGCGKTTLLRLIAGFEAPDSGQVFLGKENITDVPINKRRVNTIFQSYALFPHMNVFDNVAYSLKLKKIDSDTIEKKVIDVLRTVHLDTHIYKSINNLSGGQQQRVAIARAIINEPEVLLLDEPLAALDKNLREKVLVELKELQKSLKTTFVYVTHDQREALTVSHQIAVINHDGEIEQIGTPKEIYEFPKSQFVADFIGTTNIIDGNYVVRDGVFFVSVDGEGEFLIGEKNNLCSDGKVSVSIRPEKIFISKNKLDGFSNFFVGNVKSIVYQGRSTQYLVTLKSGIVISVFEQNEEHLFSEFIEAGDVVNLYWQKDSVVTFCNSK